MRATARMAVRCLVLALTLATGLSHAEDPPAVREAKRKALVARVERFAQRHGTFRARFVQTVTFRDHDQTRVRRGTVAIGRPHSLAFRYDDGDWVVRDGKWVHAFVATEKTRYQMKASSSLHPATVAFFSDDLKLTEHFEVRRVEIEGERGADEAVLEAVPKKKSPAFVRMWLLIAKKTGAVRRVMIIDAQGNLNRFVFEKPEYGVKLPKKTFRRPKTPRGTKVVKP